ncbi:hypothetical protein GR702_21315 [Novosphingobium sp. FGD1]|uniref:HhH-GPD domain-containing protein n=1 Tax=Novosphingobium silvae TaxID=2692619 RepID=A0A7X4GKF9_9SPHN|nr:hypothetical protein [Novosphingobium silvae]MYM00288.1 hypothetical protein [Novosphingobium silvae]
MVDVKPGRPISCRGRRTPTADRLQVGEKRKLTRLRSDLLNWARQAGRVYPWRANAASSYERIVVEVLLQRTTATAVSKFYDAFFSRFPTWEALALAQPEDLATFLKPLGLWRKRAASLLGLAKYAISVSGQFPRNPRERRKIPAIGQYVSSAIALFQYGEPAPLLDVNMSRVIERFIHPRSRADIRHDPWLRDAASWFARGPQPEMANWAILDFAALVCKSRRPRCSECPVRPRCNYVRSK